jgi:predicted component of type VI protein secretion system
MPIYGELSPISGGDPIPLLKPRLMVGRRESCDVVLRFPNISSHHCLLTLDSGYWYIQDQNSTNGIKVNGARCQRKRIDPGDKVTIAKHTYTIEYSPMELGAVGPPPPDRSEYEMLRGTSIMERAGLVKKKDFDADLPVEKPKNKQFRYDILDDSPGQIKRARQESDDDEEIG